MKIIANSIMEHCKEQGLSFEETRQLLQMMLVRIDDERCRVTDEMMKRKMGFKPF